MTKTPHRWAFLTNHARVMLCIAHDPGIRLREIGERVGITERAAHRIVTELDSAGYIARERNGRRNQYTINSPLPLQDVISHDGSVGELLAILTAPRPATQSPEDDAVLRGETRERHPSSPGSVLTMG